MRASITTAERVVPVLLAALWASGSPAGARGLAAEKSPYLVQHSSDAVDWRPWGPAAFAEAAKADKPIFLSIGFSTCLWCEVMRKESFSNPEIAALLNGSFVPVLVDREERPDIDRAYMSAAAAAGWGGGWPLNLWLTPERKPFFGGNYFPPEAKGGVAGLRPTLARVAELWRTRREDALLDAEDAAKALEAYLAAGKGQAAPASALLDAAYEAYRRDFDAAHGGFGPPPRFPDPDGVRFLLAYSARTGKKEARDMALANLRAIARGGLHDSAGGFHRYAAGADWSGAHLEKLLSVNAGLAAAYLEAYRATGDKDLAATARETLDYMLLGLGRPGGGFHAAERGGEKDEKILAADNGLALEALALGARVLEEPRYLAAAAETAAFLRNALYDEKAGVLYRRWLDGDRAVPAFEEDYAFLIAGLLEMRRAKADSVDRGWAARLAEAAPAKPDESLLQGPEDDGAAAVAALNARELAALTGLKSFVRSAEEALKRLAPQAAAAPREHPAVLRALELSLPASEKKGKR